MTLQVYVADESVYTLVVINTTTVAKIKTEIYLHCDKLIFCKYIFS